MRIPEWFLDDHRAHEIETRALGGGDAQALKEIETLSQGVNGGWIERTVQNYLMERPYLLLGRYRTGHGTYAFGEASLGNQHKIDWAVANGNSGGLDWSLIELECPQKLPFKKNGHLSVAARAGVEQIQDWRDWIKNNLDYASRPKSKNGLGLHDIDANLGVVVVGRRSMYDSAEGRSEYDRVRRKLRDESHIEVISYESFFESLKFRFLK